jgi:hypothetical protein
MQFHLHPGKVRDVQTQKAATALSAIRITDARELSTSNSAVGLRKLCMLQKQHLTSILKFIGNFSGRL